MSNYNLTNQEISSSFQQVMQHDKPTGLIYDGTGSLIENLSVTSSEATHALTASYAENAQQIDTGSFATTGSNTFTGINTFDAQVILNDYVSLNSTLETFSSNINNFGGRIQGVQHGFDNGTSNFTGSFSGDASGLTNVTASNGGVTSIIAGNNINIDQSTGDVTISSTTTASADWNNLTNKPVGIVSGSSQLTSSYDTRYQLSGSEASLPSGVVSGSSQIILQSTTGDLSGSRIDGQVSSALSASHADFATTSSFALNFNPSATTSYALFSEEAENAEHADAVQFPVIAKETLTKGDPVYVSGYNSGESKPEVLKADASDSSKMPVVGLAMVNASNNDHIFIAVAGNFADVDTDTGLTSPSVGDTLYVASGGGYTNVKPTGTNLIQNIGVIGRVQQNNGEIVVSAIQRSNDLPNIQEGYAWVGDGSGVPQAVATSSFAGGGGTIDTGSFATTGSNVFVGDQTISGSLILQDSIEAGGNVVAPNGAVEAAEVAASNAFFDNIQSNGAAQVTIQKDTVISGSTTFQDVNPAPGATFSVRAGGASPVLDINNSALGTITGTDYVLNGNGLINGNTTQNGAGLLSGSFIVKDASGAGPLNIFDVNNSTNTIIGVSNPALAGITGTEVVINTQNGDTLFDGGSSSKVESKLPLIVSSSNGTSTFKDTQAGPANTFIVNDGSSDRLTVVNSALAGIVGTNVTVQGNIGISGEIVMSSAGQVIDIPNGTVNSNELVANIAVIEEIESGTGTINLLSETHFKNGIRTDVGTIGISNSTASIDFNDTTMQTLTLPSSGDTRLEFSNASDGRVTNLLVKATGVGTVSFGSNILQPSGSSYQATPVNGGRDILTFTTFDNSTTSEVYLINVVNLV